MGSEISGIKEGRQRVVVSNLTPEIDGGRFAIKRALGETVDVEADVFADGHDVLTAVLLHRAVGAERWSETPMEPLANDRWRGSFRVNALGSYVYTVQGWVDHFKSWRRDLERKVNAGMEVAVELLGGAELLRQGATRASSGDGAQLNAWAKQLASPGVGTAAVRVELALDDRVMDLMGHYPDRRLATTYEKELRVAVDPVLARFSAWYEFFPRSCSPTPGKHGTFKDCESQLPRLAAMGFDIVYLAPIHPIGRSFRKGKNNAPAGTATDSGSPWAIGSAEGGHTSIHPELGTLEDFRHFVQSARDLKLEIALDVAFQSAPDHPYVTEGRPWFRQRADGTIQYAENPPKKYQDIYPFDFETEHWRDLWVEMKRIFEFWVEQGVKVFRVDNPHTKPFAFWEWCLGELRQRHPELIFLSEAFTRPKMMYQLAKLGFNQSYNYFPWRNNKVELMEYFKELTQTDVREYFRPNLWPNTPDILTQYLQYGGRSAFMIRLILAATLGASYGIYGPPFELCESRPRELGSEEYLDSEKYELRHWDLHAPGNLSDLITNVNRIRRENKALHSNRSLEFHPVDNEQIIAYSKKTADLDNIILVVVNLDPHHIQSGFVSVALEYFEIEPQDNYQVHDLLTGARYLWRGSRNYVSLNPQTVPAHVLRFRRRVRSEQDFDYFL